MNELIRMRLFNLLGRTLALATPAENIKYVFRSAGRPHATRHTLRSMERSIGVRVRVHG